MASLLIYEPMKSMQNQKIRMLRVFFSLKGKKIEKNGLFDFWACLLLDYHSSIQKNSKSDKRLSKLHVNDPRNALDQTIH